MIGKESFLDCGNFFVGVRLSIGAKDQSMRRLLMSDVEKGDSVGEASLRCRLYSTYLKKASPLIKIELINNGFQRIL